MKSILLTAVLIFSCDLFPAEEKKKLPVAKVLAIRGTATYNGEKINKGQELKKSGLIKVESKSFVKVKVKKWGNTITLGPRAEMELELESPKAKKRYSLVGGACRWVTETVKKKAGKISGNGALFTKQASMGVRGTDYFVKVNKLLGETEIIVFDGKVEFSSLTDAKDTALINKGQWGGLGGRFGEKIGKVLDLPAEMVGHFGKMLILNE